MTCCSESARAVQYGTVVFNVLHQATRDNLQSQPRRVSPLSVCKIICSAMPERGYSNEIGINQNERTAAAIALPQANNSNNTEVAMHPNNETDTRRSRLSLREFAAGLKKDGLPTAQPMGE